MQETEKIRRPTHGNNYSFMLQAGEWRKWFTEEQYKLIIAQALNDCVYYEELGPTRMVITGYYINSQRVYLILKARHAAINKVLDLFFEKVRNAIRMELNKWLHLPGHFEKKEQLDMIRMYEVRLFEKFPFINDWLVHLITGRKVVLKCYDTESDTYVEYFDPRLERLKRMIKQETYCSAIDYAGGESPVIITVPDDTERI